jgi:flagellar basal body-associated protein FliL
MPPLLHQGIMTTKTLRKKRKRLIKTILLIIHVSLIIRMLTYCLFHLENPLTSMEKIIPSRVIKMRSHLFSLHPSIWEIVENGMHFYSSDNPILTNEQIHKNAQATTVLLSSLCKDEYNKVSGLDNAKQIWDTLKISHEGNNATMITKMELVEGELGRFAMKRGEEPTETYNRLKTLVNKI